MEIERIVGEVLPTNQPMSPASEQFLGGLVRKVGKLVSSAAKTGLKLAGKGLALAGKLALGPLLGPLKKLARFLLGHVVKWALNKIPASLRPLAQKLSDRLFHALGETHEGEAEQYEQTETENVPTAPDIGRLEAEFDLHAAQLLLTPDETEADHLVTTYGESADQTDASPLRTLDRARAELTVGLSRLQPGESRTACHGAVLAGNCGGLAGRQGWHCDGGAAKGGQVRRWLACEPDQADARR